MKCLFGEVTKNEVKLTNIGEKVKECWLQIPEHFNAVSVDEFVIMPNHLHGIVLILKDPPVGVQYIEPLHKSKTRTHKFQKTLPGSISIIISSFKAAVTRWANSSGIEFKWQRNFYERVIRNENELYKIREYIYYNPVKWNYEKEKNDEDLFVI